MTMTSAVFQIGAAAGPSGAGRSTVGLYHLAWEVDTLTELKRLAGSLAQHGALTGSSDHGTTKSLYGKDPDGLEFEVAWIVPADRLDDSALAGAQTDPTARPGPRDRPLRRRHPRRGRHLGAAVGHDDCPGWRCRSCSSSHPDPSSPNRPLRVPAPPATADGC